MGTPLTAASSTLVTHSGTADMAFQNTATVPFLSVTAGNKSQWDGAEVQLTWTYSRAMGGDNQQIYVSALELNGTYTASAMNNPPVHDSAVVDDGDPVLEGSDVTFTVDWSDSDDSGTAITAYVCDTGGITPGSGCNGTTYASKNNPADPTNATDLVYTTGESDNGAISYEAFVCDDEPSCSSASAGTFTVNEQTLVIDAFTPNPASGTDPLDTFFNVDISGTATGTINYSVWWDCTGQDAEENVSTVEGACGALPAPGAGTCASNAAGYKCNGVSNDPQRVPESGTYQYTPDGSYNAKVIVERGLADAATNVLTAVQTITVNAAAGGPSVTTKAATGITQTAATLDGEANPNGVATTGWYRYWTTNPGSCSDAGGTRVPGAGGDALGSGTGVVPIDDENSFRILSGLTPNTQHWFCAIAEDTNPVKNVGSLLTFTTLPDPPTSVSTDPVTDNTTGTTATLTGSADTEGDATDGTNDGGWFRLWQDGSQPGTCAAGDSETGGSDSGSRFPSTNYVVIANTGNPEAYSSGATGLTKNVTYHYCAYAKNDGGATAAPSMQTFITPDVMNNVPNVTGVTNTPEPTSRSFCASVLSVLSTSPSRSTSPRTS